VAAAWHGKENKILSWSEALSGGAGDSMLGGRRSGLALGDFGDSPPPTPTPGHSGITVETHGFNVPLISGTRHFLALELLYGLVRKQERK